MRLLLPFIDDSTLFFAARVRSLLATTGHTVVTAHHSLETDYSGVTDRQIATVLPKGPDITTPSDFFRSSNPALSDYDAVVFCRPSRDLTALGRDKSFLSRRERPRLVAYLGGLDFTPEKGMRNRAMFDAVFLNSDRDAQIYRSLKIGRRDQFIGWGHPYYVLSPRRSLGENIYFFAQALSPATWASREFICRVLKAIARGNPNRKVFLKLRHLPGENDRHKHKEVFAYPDIVGPDGPANLHMTACSMSEAIEDAGIAITCTSTAAMETIGAGIPTMIYLDYIERYRDPLTGPMAAEFAGSDLITDTTRLLQLRAREPNPTWLQTRFRSHAAFISELEAAISQGRTPC